MPKRMVNTDRWKIPFFKNLPPAQKLLWMFINDDCDFCGVWIVDFEIASIRVGMPLKEEESKKIFEKHIIILDGGARWFIPEFVATNYGTLQAKNVVHKRIIEVLERDRIYDHKPIVNDPNNGPLNGSQEKEEEEEEIILIKNKESEKKTAPELPLNLWPSFDDFWELYDKKIDRVKCEKKWNKLSQADKDRIMFHIPVYIIQQPDRKFRKDPYSYLFNQSWNNEVYEPQTKLPSGASGRQEPFTDEVSRKIQSKFADVARHRAKQP